MISFKAHSGQNQGVRFLADGNTLITNGRNQEFRFWRLPEAVRTRQIKRARTSLFDLPSHGRFIALGGDEGLEILNVSSGAEETVFAMMHDFQKIETMPWGMLTSLKFSPLGDTLAIRGWSQRFLLLRTDNWEPMNATICRAELKSQREPLANRGLDFSGDGKLLATSDWFRDEQQRYVGVFQVWEIETSSLLNTFHIDPELSFIVSKLEFDPSSAVLFWILEFQFGFWNRLTGESRLIHSHPNRSIRDFRFLNDRKNMILIGYDGLVRVFETETWSEIRQYDWQIGKLGGLDVAPDGLRIAVGGEKGQVVIWDVDF